MDPSCCMLAWARLAETVLTSHDRQGLCTTWAWLPQDIAGHPAALGQR